MLKIEKRTNDLWNHTSPEVTVITSTYNRRELLERAMRSVEAQSYKNIEYIVVDNGSSIDLDPTVEAFMNSSAIPVMYIKRSEGIGPHTGKNSAIAEARGEYLIMLDSDDELLPNAVETLLNAWNDISLDVRPQFREVVARCIDENGNEIGERFPQYINKLSPEEAFKVWHRPQIATEHVGMNRTKLLKSLPFPEPEGVSWVVDSVVLWNRLSKSHRSYFINDTLKRYYVGTPDSISNQEIRKVSPQHLVNMLWAHKFELNHWDEYAYSFRDRLDRTLKVSLYTRVLRKLKMLPKYDWVSEPINGFMNNVLRKLWDIPCLIIGTRLFIARKM